MGFLEYLNKKEENKKTEVKEILKEQKKVVSEEICQEKLSIVEHVNNILDGITYQPDKEMKSANNDNSIDHINSILN
jgi:hypothetical protein